MKIVLDYGGELPSEDLQKKMEFHKQWAIEKLQPIWEEFESSEGILILHTDSSFEFKETPYPIGMKIKKLLGVSYF